MMLGTVAVRALQQRPRRCARSKNAKVTLVCRHELPNVAGNSIKRVPVEYGPGGYSPGHTHAKSAFIYATVLKGRSAVRSMTNW
jgi:quercetin dioxygenase-like cupin family protein